MVRTAEIELFKDFELDAARKLMSRRVRITKLAWMKLDQFAVVDFDISSVYSPALISRFKIGDGQSEDFDAETGRSVIDISTYSDLRCAAERYSRRRSA